MKRAIENYAVGKQREVTAWAGMSIPASSGRFYCPECFESVALDKRGHFRHKNRTPESMECEQRVDSPSVSTYEKMGLPFYLREENEAYRLYIGFPSIPENYLQQAMHESSYITMDTGNGKSTKYNISSERFSSDHFTMVPVNETPFSNGRFWIDYHNNTPWIIRKRWSYQSDVWGDCQFFKCEGTYLRKIRQLGAIIADHDYLFIGNTMFFQSYSKFVSIKKEGNLIINNSIRDVFRININYNENYSNQFSQLSLFLMQRYRISLLTDESELIPFWPPCSIDDNYLIYPSNSVTAFLEINSPNTHPEVYYYTNNIYHSLSFDSSDLVEVPLSEDEYPFSVDRAFNGYVQFIRKQKQHPGRVACEIDIVDESGISIIDSELKTIKGRSFWIKSSCAANVYLLKENGNERKYKIESPEGIELKNVEWNDSLMIYSLSGRYLKGFRFIRSHQNRTLYGDELVERLKKCSGPVVNINNVLIDLLKRANNNPTLRPVIQKYTKQKYIPISAIKILKSEFGGK